MFETRIDLGRGILKNLSTVTLKNQETSIDNIWTTIEEFGIQRDHLKRLNPSYQELFEIYSAIRAYRISVKYLKELKNKFA